MEVIRKAFSHVEVERIVVEYEPLVDAQVVKIFVRDDQLEAALADNGAIARRAAIDSGMNVEVCLSAE
jgi:transcription antitermination factor NusA-like protein